MEGGKGKEGKGGEGGKEGKREGVRQTYLGPQAQHCLVLPVLTLLLNAPPAGGIAFDAPVAHRDAGWQPTANRRPPEGNCSLLLALPGPGALAAERAGAEPPVTPRALQTKRGFGRR